MKKALVTGADGFIGSFLTEELVNNGYQVKALAQYNSFNHWGWLEETIEWFTKEDNLKKYKGDIYNV